MSTFIEDNADLPLVRLCRRDGPDTSLEAVGRASLDTHRAIVLDALRRGPAGQTEIARRCGLHKHEVNKRLSDLQKLRKAELTGRKVQGGREREWRVVA